MRAIGQGGVDAESASQASRAVSQLQQELQQLQQGQAAVELQLKYSSTATQLGQVQPQLEEQQRLLARWEGRLGRQLETIVGLQKSALSARSSKTAAGIGGGVVPPSASAARASFGENSPMQTPSSAALAFRPAGGM